MLFLLLRDVVDYLLKPIALDETFTSIALVSEKFVSLIQNYPNPFNTTTTIKYKVRVPGFVSLKIFDQLGKKVVSLVNEKKPVGEYTIDWTAS